MVLLNSAQMKKVLVLAGVIVLGNCFVFAQSEGKLELPGQASEKPGILMGERKEIKREKNSWDLIEETKKENKIDDETAILYKVYLFNAPEMLPAEYRVELSTIPGYYGHHGPYYFEERGFGRELEESWNGLKSETKEKIKELIWRKRFQYPFGPSPQPSITIFSPKNSDVVSGSDIDVKGNISTPKVYDLTAAWIEFAGGRKEVELGNPTYEKGREYDSNKPLIERIKDKPGLEEVYSQPGRLVRQFSEKITLPGPGIYSLMINAQNSYVGRTDKSNKASETVWIVYPPKEKKDNEPPKIEITGVKDGESVNENRVFVTFNVSDESRILGMLYLNNQIWGNVSKWLQRGIPLENGLNTIKTVVTDEYGNTTTKEVKVFREK